jgi:hypothetical protein
MLLRWTHYCRTWLRNFISIEAVSAVLSSFGALWLMVQITSFFLDGTKWPDAVRNLWWLFGLAGLLIAAWRRRPRLTVSHKLNGRDVTIEIVVGDLFALPGALIIGSNTTFDTRISRELISEKSIQGIFTRKFYGEETQLDIELSSCLSNVTYCDLAGNRVGKAKRYPMGTCVRLNPKQRTSYFVAIADINEHGVASGTPNGLKESLAKLWVFIGRRGLKESLVMPVLGTGFTRLNLTREEIIREIIKSFIAACSEKTFADKLTIVITHHDMLKYCISLNELGLFLRHECLYVSFSSGNQEAIGMAV